MKEPKKKDCKCHTCNKEYHSNGIAAHRAMHERKKQNCEITYSTGETITHFFPVLRITVRKRKKHRISKKR